MASDAATLLGSDHTPLLAVHVQPENFFTRWCCRVKLSVAQTITASHQVEKSHVTAHSLCAQRPSIMLASLTFASCLLLQPA
jgi:hypothetical protein